MKVVVGQKVKFIDGFYKDKEGICITNDKKSCTFNIEDNEVRVSLNELPKYVKLYKVENQLVIENI